MRGLSLIIALFGVIALLTLGAGGAWASSQGAVSCHETSATHDGGAMPDDAPTPSHTPAKALMVMACCVACVSPVAPPAPAAVTAAHPRPAQPARFDLPSGQLPSPDPAPPKTRL